MAVTNSAADDDPPPGESPITFGAAIPTRAERRRGLFAAQVNGLCWALGNGFIGSGLVLYIAAEWNAPGLGLSIGVILAAPKLAGLLRLAAPALLARIGSRKRFCIASYLASALILLLLPPLAFLSPDSADPRGFLALLVGIWCAYHLHEYCGTIALWSWLTDLCPRRLRGRFVGRRERWMLTGQLVAMGLAAGLNLAIHAQVFGPALALSRAQGYVLTGSIGVLLLIIAALVLLYMPEVPRPLPREAAIASDWRLPFRDLKFWRFLAFGGWLGFSNGVTQSPQNVFFVRVLGISLGMRLALEAGMKSCQWIASPRVGRLADRIGNRPILIVAQAAVAGGLFFYFLATPATWWLVICAWILWIAFVGHNVALPTGLLKLSSEARSAAYISAYFALVDLAYAVGSLGGGLLFDLYGRQRYLLFGVLNLSYIELAFLVGILLRLVGVLIASQIDERPPEREGSDDRG